MSDPEIEGTELQEPILKAVRDFVFRHFPLARKRRIGDETSLIEEGIIDSMGILEVVMFMENDLGLQVSDEDMLSQNFESIHSLAEFVQSRRGM